MFKEIEGNLFELNLPAIGHGVNCRGAMHAGIANVFRLKFPDMYLRYSLMCDSGRMVPGKVMAWAAGDLIVFNLATQLNPGADATLEAVEEAVRAAVRRCDTFGIEALGLPRIGCGIGGLEWADVKAIMVKVAGEFPSVDVVAVSLPGTA